MSAIGGGRRKTAFEILGTRVQTFLQPRRQRTADHELPFQTRRQVIFLGQTRRKMGLMFAIPAADVFFVMFVVVAVARVLMFLVALTVAVTMLVVLGKGGSAGEEEAADQNSKDPFSRFH